ncbi:MAG TPA: DUF1592 domain-containing protein, partial [Pirellulaceae bacterium]|nr:DUF1592 domain-containing protein [Pirellulaceae bacterium]
MAVAAELTATFPKDVKPFFTQHCERCHNGEKLTSGVRVDHLDAALEDRHLRLWEAVRREVDKKAMPPEDEKQPTAEERERLIAWIDRGLAMARSRPVPKNGGARRLTVAQYRHTLRELLLLEDELADVLPPDAVSRDGFVNNQETLALSPLLLEAYFDIADQALRRCIVDVNQKPRIQNFRVEMGTDINREPCPDRLILGANSVLLRNQDFVVTQLKARVPFPFDPFYMQTKYRFIEGYAGNDTVRGWREYDSIYHSVFACLRGSVGYPKGHATDVVPEGLLLRPSITSDEEFQGDLTYGPKANFKISLRELPDEGRFRVTVVAAKYDDGLLLDAGDPPAAPAAQASPAAQATQAAQAAGDARSIVVRDPQTAQKIDVPRGGVYQIDALPQTAETKLPPPDGSKLTEGLIGAWSLDGVATSTPAKDELAGRLVGDAKFVDSPFGKALSLDGAGDWLVVPRHESMSVGTGEFTVAAWINPTQLRQAGIVCLGKYAWTHGWYLDMPTNQGVLRIETAGPDNAPHGTVASRPGAIRTNTWQHVAAVVRRGAGQTKLYVNGYQVASGTIGPGDLDNRKVDLQIGRIQDAQQFQGDIDDVRIFRRALTENELQALVEPGRKFATAPPPEKPQELTVVVGGREFAGILNRPAFVVARLPAGPLDVVARYAGSTRLDQLVLTPLPAEHPVARRFEKFEKRAPRVGVHIGLRRDCGSTLTQVGGPQTVSSVQLGQFVFEGAIRNFPSPDVEKDNVNYLAGVREIGVRSEFTDGRDMPRLLVKSVEFEGPLYESWPPPTHRNLFIDSPNRANEPVYAREVIRNFATRAFRRPVRAPEEASLVAVYEKSRAGGASFQDAVRDALQVVLTSPQFLMLIEASESPAPEPLDDYELASKLSYFLWNSPPDRALQDVAAAGTLRERLDGEVRRMVDDPRFERFTSEFTAQWLALDKFAVLEPDRNKFPKLTRDIRAQLRREPQQFVQHLIRNNLPVGNLIRSDFIIANEVVADYYGLGEQIESGFQFAALTHGRRELGGVLGQAAILAGLSDGRESNPIKRGAWMARRIVAEPPDDPPPNVPALKEENRNLSLRDRLEQHRNQPGCAQCHTKVDPWGLALEEFDAG